MEFFLLDMPLRRKLQILMSCLTHAECVFDKAVNKRIGFDHPWHFRTIAKVMKVVDSKLNFQLFFPMVFTDTELIIRNCIHLFMKSKISLPFGCFTKNLLGLVEHLPDNIILISCFISRYKP